MRRTVRSNMHETPERDEGFTLVEMLVVVLVISLLAAIAIPQFMDQRERAWEASAQSTLHDGILAQQGHATDNDVFTSVLGDLVGAGFTDSAEVDFWIDGSTTAARFQVHAQHCNGGDQFRFVSDGAATIERLARAARAC